MPLGEDEPVTIRPFRIGRVVPQDVEEECDQNFDGGQRAARVSGLGRRDHLDDLAAGVLRDPLELTYIRGLLHM